MTRRRAPDFDLSRAVADPGFTPRLGDAPALLEGYARADALLPAYERALLRLGDELLPTLVEALGTSPAATRAAYTLFASRLLGDLGGKPPAPSLEPLQQTLLQGLRHEDERVRRHSAAALGRCGPETPVEPLAQALRGEKAASVRRALVTTLGKLGAKEALLDLAEPVDALALDRQVQARALLVATRERTRLQPSRIVLAPTLPESADVVLRCRAGLEGLVLDTLGRGLRARRPAGPRDGAAAGRVLVTLPAGTSPDVLSRDRVHLDWGFRIPVDELPPSASEKERLEALVRALAGPRALRLLRTFTEGPIRFRLSWSRGGKHRATTWRLAEAISGSCPDLVNDPRESPWEVRVRLDTAGTSLELCPQGVDTRFSWRRGDVPAASHPTLAAALVQVAGVRPDDAVWDPFTGSGSELCERAMAGPFRRLVGTDLEAGALETATSNLEGVGAKAELVLADCTRFQPGPLSLVLSNPPMGRRVHRSADLGPLLQKVVQRVALFLERGGRLVWLSPLPSTTLEAARRAGLRVVLRQEVDMGGFTAELQRFDKA